MICPRTYSLVNSGIARSDLTVSCCLYYPFEYDREMKLSKSTKSIAPTTATHYMTSHPLKIPWLLFLWRVIMFNVVIANWNWILKQKILEYRLQLANFACFDLLFWTYPRKYRHSKIKLSYFLSFSYFSYEAIYFAELFKL